MVNSEEHRIEKTSDSVFDLKLLRESLDQLFLHSEKNLSIDQDLLQFIAKRFPGSGALSLDKIDGVLLENCGAVVTPLGDSWSGELLQTMRAGAQRVVDKRQVAVARLGQSSTVALIAVPVSGNNGISHVLSVAFSLRDQPVDCYVAILQLIATCLSVSLKSRNLLTEVDDTLLEPSLEELIVATLEADNRRDARQSFVQGLKKFFEADLVIFAPGIDAVRSQTLIHSNLTGINDKAPQMKTIKQVVAECIMHNRPLVWSDSSLGVEHLSSLILKEFANTVFVKSTACLPISSEKDGIKGVVIVGWNRNVQDLEQRLEQFQQAGSLLAGLQSRLTKTRYIEKVRKQFKEKKVKLTLSLLGLTMTVGVAFFPVVFSVTGNCILQPKQTRYVVAQFDSLLKTVYKTSGAEVKKGDHLALLDGRLIELEINSLLADIQKSKKKHDFHLAAGETAFAQMAELERKGYHEKLMLQEDRFKNLEILSPVEGVVISNNLERIEGSPLSRGQGLFEVAPLQTLVAEAHISQEDIGFIIDRAKVRIALESYPAKKYHSTVDLIFPRSELRNGRNIFIVESLLENREKLLRPGMQGELTVDVGKRPLIWKLFRTPWLHFQKMFLTE